MPRPEAMFSPQRAMIQLDHTVRIRIGQRVQHDALHDGEDRRVRADGERQRQHGRQRERRTAREPPCRVRISLRMASMDCRPS